MSAAEAERSPLTVCADPDNLPVSNTAGEGFENKLAAVLAQEVGKPLTYMLSSKPDVATALSSGQCDLVVGVPMQLGGVETTRPYYWSSYVLLSRADRQLDITSLKDKRLHTPEHASFLVTALMF